MYCAWRIPAHLRCTQCSILLHLMDICFLTCICLWQISHIQTRLFSVVGPGLVSTSPAFVSSSASHPAGPHGRHAQKTVNRGPPLLGAGGFDTICTAVLVCCDSSTTCRLCRLEPEPIPHTQHRPIRASANPVVVAHPTPYRRRFNLRKAGWDGYSTVLIEDVEPIPEHYGGFVGKVRVA